MKNEELVNMIQREQDARENMETLYAQNKGLIYEAVNHFEGLADPEDMAQEGYLAFYQAVIDYDANRGMSFATYARSRVRWWLLRYIENSGIIKIPVGIHQQMRNYNKVVEKLTHKYGCEPSDEQIRQSMRLNHKQYKALIKCMSMGFLESLDSPVSSAEDCLLYELIPTGEDMEGGIIDQENTEGLKTALWGAVDALPAKQAAVLNCRYRKEKRLVDVSEELGLTYDQTKEEERKGLKGLRSFKYKKRFMHYLPSYLEGCAYRGTGLQIFKETWTSSTERTAIKMVESG